MTVKDLLQEGMQNLMDSAGNQIKIVTWSGIYDSVYDTLGSLVPGSATWTSGIVNTISTKAGTSEALLVQQGLLSKDDLILYVSGGIRLTGSEDMITVQVGSPGNIYQVIPNGINMPQVAGTQIYKKIYLTKNYTGSFYGL